MTELTKPICPNTEGVRVYESRRGAAGGALETVCVVASAFFAPGVPRAKPPRSARLDPSVPVILGDSLGVPMPGPMALPVGPRVRQDGPMTGDHR
jgi:hypothetical protein